MPFVENNEFVEWVKGKTVAIVGPAASAEEFSNGDLIDSYDIVCRIKSLWVPEDKRVIYGSRLDVLYTDNNETNDVLPGDFVSDHGDKRKIMINPRNAERRRSILSDDIKYVVSTYPRSEWFFDRFVQPLNEISLLTKVRIMPDQPYMSIRKETNRPNAGFSAIIDMVSLPAKEIFITGLDFYRSLYRPSYLNSLYTKETILAWGADGTTPDGTPDKHNPDLQFKYFKNNIWNLDERIKVDPFMEMVLKDPRYEDFETAMSLLEKAND